MCQGFDFDDEIYTNAWLQNADPPYMNLRIDFQLRNLGLFQDVDPNELHSGYDLQGGRTMEVQSFWLDQGKFYTNGPLVDQSMELKLRPKKNSSVS